MHIVERLLDGIQEGRWAELHNLYASDATVELPFYVGGPLVLQGQEALQRHFAAASKAPMQIAVENVRIYEATTPGVLIAEFDYQGKATKTGRDFKVANVQVFEIEDGLIVRSRDYHDHVAMAAAMGATSPPPA